MTLLQYFVVTVAATVVGGLILYLLQKRYERTRFTLLHPIFRWISSAARRVLGLIHACIARPAGLRFLGAILEPDGEFASTDMAAMQTLLEPEYSRGELQAIAARLHRQGYLCRDKFEDFRPGTRIEPSEKARRYLPYWARRRGSRSIAWIRRRLRTPKEQQTYLADLENARKRLMRQYDQGSYWPGRYERRAQQLSAMLETEKLKETT